MNIAEIATTEATENVFTAQCDLLMQGEVETLVKPQDMVRKRLYGGTSTYRVQQCRAVLVSICLRDFP